MATVCPAGTREVGTSLDDLEWGCELESEDGWIRHGPYRSFFPSGELASEGEYALLVMGAILVGVMLLAPTGIVTTIADFTGRFRSGRARPATAATPSVKER